MLNQTILVGRLADKPNLKELESSKKVCHITLAVPRSFKNIEGIYETDFINCILFDSVASKTCEYCEKGDLVGIKGRLQTHQIDNKNIIEVIAEKVTFLSNKKED